MKGYKVTKEVTTCIYGSSGDHQSRKEYYTLDRSKANDKFAEWKAEYQEVLDGIKADDSKGDILDNEGGYLYISQNLNEWDYNIICINIQIIIIEE